MIKIIAGVYGYWNGTCVVPKTKDDAPFTLEPGKEKRLVDLGIAKYVDEPPVPEEPVEEIPEAEEAEETEIAEEAPVTIESLKALKMAELQKMADEYGVDFKVGMKKAELAELVYNAIVEYEEGPELTDPTESIV